MLTDATHQPSTLNRSQWTAWPAAVDCANTSVIMRDLRHPRLMYLKALLLLLLGALATTLILLEHPSLKVAFLIGVAVWSFARAYYFAFYVIEHYIDPAYRFAGILSAIRHALRR